jgi:hypothetical protein
VPSPLASVNVVGVQSVINCTAKYVPEEAVIAVVPVTILLPCILNDLLK